MAKIRMIVIEGEMEVDDVRRLAQAFSAGDAAFTSVTLPSGVTGQAATLSKGEDKPRPRPLAVPEVVTYQPEPVAAPEPAVTTATPPPAKEIPPTVAKVFPEAVIVEQEEPPTATDLVADLLACKRLSGVLERLQQAGHAGLPALIEACKTYRDSVPLLQRLGEGLEDRITRTFEGMK